MMEIKKEVDEYNKSKTDETTKKVWSGDFVQEPVPLKADGTINEEAITDPSERRSMRLESYQRVDWNIPTIPSGLITTNYQ